MHHGHSHGGAPCNGHEAPAGPVRSKSTYVNVRSIAIPRAVSLVKILASIVRNSRTHRLLWFVLLDSLFFVILLGLSFAAESHALGALAMFSAFHTMAIIAHLITFWALEQRPEEFHSFGYVRAEALSFFTVAILTILGAIVCVKEAVEHILHNQDNDFLEEPMAIDFSVFVALFVGLFMQLWFTYLSHSTVLFKGAMRSPPRPVPFLSNLNGTLHEKNVHVIGGLSCYACAIIVFLVISFDDRLHILDSMAAAFSSFWLLFIALPICITNALILLQTAPAELTVNLEKCLREIATFDGVLEYGNEHFWLVAHDVIAGSLFVRVRRDASEQLVLSQIIAKFAPYIAAKNLTVQVVKDDWVAQSMPRKSAPL